VLWGALLKAQSNELVGTFSVTSATGSDPSPTVVGTFNSTVGFLPQNVDTGDILLVRQVFTGNHRRKLYRITGVTGNSPLTLNVTLINGTSGGPFPTGGTMAIFRPTEKGALLDVPNVSQEIESYIANYNTQHFEDADVDTTINRSDSMFVVLNDGTEFYVGPSAANGISDSYQVGDSIFVVTGTDTIFTGIAYANTGITSNITTGNLSLATGNRLVPMNHNSLTFDSVANIRFHADNYYFGNGSSPFAPDLNSDHIGFGTGIEGDGELVYVNRLADRTITGSGAPVDGTTIAWYAGQIYTNTTDNTLYRAITKSTNPDFSGAGSTWSVVGVSTGDKGDIDVVNSINDWRVDTSSITSLKVQDGTLLWGDLNASLKDTIHAKNLSTIGYNPTTRILTLSMADGTTKTGAIFELLTVPAAPTGLATYPVAIDTVGTDTMYVNNNGAWVMFGVGGGSISNNSGFGFISDTLYSKGLSQSGSLTSDYSYLNIDSTQTKILSVSPYGGWITPSVSSGVGAWVKITAPYGVVIGNSIVEGHPGLHGRLHPNASSYSPYYPDSVGQISYHLKELTGYRWYNHGIGGQTSSQVWSRWDRDVLADSVAIGDGRGNLTLPKNRKPYIVLVGCGANDVAAGATSSTRANLLAMAQSCQSNNILAIFQTIGANTSWTTAQVDTLRAINSWMAATLPLFGAVISDYNAWSQDPAHNDDKHVKPSYFSDNIHPNKAGYQNYVESILANINIPKISKIHVYAQVDGPGNFARPSTIQLDNDVLNISTDDYWADLSDMQLDSSIAKMLITSSVAVTGSGTYSGIAHVDWVISSRNPANLTGNTYFTGEVEGYYNDLRVNGGVINNLTPGNVPVAATSESVSDSNIKAISGKVGLSTSSNPVADLQIDNVGIESISEILYLTNNTYFDGANWKYIKNGPGAFFNLSHSGNRGFGYSTAPLGTAGNTASYTQKLKFYGYSGGMSILGGLKVGSISDTTLTGIVDANVGYRLNGSAASGNYLRGNGTNFVSSAIQLTDIPTLNGDAWSANASIANSSRTDTLTNSLAYGFFQRVGPIVNFTVKFEVALNSDTTSNVVSVSPPYASDFTDEKVDVGGTATINAGGVYGGAALKVERCILYADPTTNKISISYTVDKQGGTYPSNRVIVSASGSYIVQ